jgi:hypothetical protein
MVQTWQSVLSASATTGVVEEMLVLKRMIQGLEGDVVISIYLRDRSHAIVADWLLLHTTSENVFAFLGGNDADEDLSAMGGCSGLGTFPARNHHVERLVVSGS